MGDNMKSELVKCSQLSVDCVVNDPVDVRCGGSDILGFDFNVREEETEEMKKFIAETLKEFDIPLLDISVVGTIDLDKNDVWTKSGIVVAIKNDADYLRSEARRNHRR